MLHRTSTHPNGNFSPGFDKADQNNKHRVCGENLLDLSHTYPNRISGPVFVSPDKSNKFVNPN